MSQIVIDFRQLRCAFDLSIPPSLPVDVRIYTYIHESVDAFEYGVGEKIDRIGCLLSDLCSDDG